MKKYAADSRKYLLAANREQTLSIKRRAIAGVLAFPSLQRKQQRKTVFSAVAIILLVGLCIVLATTSYSSVSQISPQNNLTGGTLDERNRAVSQAMAAHPVRTLVGNPQRLLTLQHVGGERMSVIALSGCPAASNAQLVARFEHDSSAFLLSSDSTDDTIADCTIEQLTARYGRPSVVTITAGTTEQPREQLVFYDHGATPRQRRDQAAPNAKSQSASRPHLLGVEQLSDTTCPGHRTIMQIVAHEDDDLLFMNPDLLHAIQRGDCVRTVYLTAGDAGSSKFYWLGRERGSESAYSHLNSGPDTWNEETLRLGNRRFARVASQVGNSQFSLLFMHLPDGKPDGSGFESSGFESLARLISGENKSIRSVDTQSEYSYSELLAALQAMIALYRPNEVRTQLPYNQSNAFSDHSDHVSVGQLATAAFDAFQPKQASLLSYYTGYPIREQPPNVDGADLIAKEQAFFRYANFDGAVCGSIEVCMASGNYGIYLQRQYRTEP